jgi:hypothetical protein
MEASEVRNTRRRNRITDPLASRAAIRGVLEGLRRRLGKWAPTAERELVGLARAAERAERKPARQEGRGRPPRWDPVQLATTLRALRRELAGRRPSRVGARTFVDHYLSILSFPSDVAEALESGSVNLFEGEQLARLSATRLGVRSATARRRRADVLAAHLGAAESGARLRARVGDLLAQAVDRVEEEPVVTESIAEVAVKLEKELDATRRSQRRRELDVDLGPGPEIPVPSPDHLFFEHLKGIAFVLGAIRPSDLKPDDLDRVLDRADALLLTLQQIKRKGRRGSTRVAV